MAHDLDDEELKATRKANGADRRNIEKLIEELTKVNPSNLSEEGLKLFNTINEIIDKNEELEKMLKSRIKYTNELEQDLFENASNYVIPKSLIKEKIEELKKQYEDYEKRWEEAGMNKEHPFYKYLIRIEAEIDILEELLKGE